jgi:Protein of unknown function (DUF3168)
MTAEELIVAQLESTPDVAELVGDRIYPGVIPIGVRLPALVYQRIGSAPLAGLQGPPMLENPTIQINAWADTYTTAKLVARAVRVALRPFVEIVPLLERDLMDPDGLRQGVGQDYSVWIEVDEW